MLKKALPLLLLLLFSSITHASSPFTDIQGSWAREAILRLAEKGVFEGIYEGRFEPNSRITKTTAIEIAARSFSLSPMAQQNLSLWLENLLPSDDPLFSDSLTRAELAALCAKLLQLDRAVLPLDYPPSFEDIPPDHTAFWSIEFAHQLDILPIYVLHRFEPQRLATRAELAALVDAALGLNVVQGTVSEVYPSSQRIIVKTLEGNFQSVPIRETTVMLAPEQSMQFTDLKLGDGLTVLSSREGQAKLLLLERNAANASLWDSLTTLTQRLGGVLSPKVLLSIFGNDLQGLGESLRYDLFEQLLELGLSPWEAEALLAKDWTGVQGLAKDKLAYEVADFAGLGPELAFALFNQDWQRALEYAQVELLQRLLNGFKL